MYDVIIKPLKAGQQEVTLYFEIGGAVKSFKISVDVSVKIPSDAEFLRERAPGILKNGLKPENLRLVGKTLTLVIDGREFVLSTNANNRNIEGEIFLGDGYYLVFDLKGNGSNVKDFRVVRR